MDKRRVLVIDDEQAARNLIAGTLKAEGFDVFAIADPDAGIGKAREIEPDLIFISMVLKKSNGLKLCKAIHSEPGLESVPIVMLISQPGELDPKYTSTIGVVDILVKPLNREEILSKTLSVLGHDFGSFGAEGEETAAYAMEGGAAEPALDDEWLSVLKERAPDAGLPSFEEEFSGKGEGKSDMFEMPEDDDFGKTHDIEKLDEFAEQTVGLDDFSGFETEKGAETVQYRTPEAKATDDDDDIRRFLAEEEASQTAAAATGHGHPAFEPGAASAFDSEMTSKIDATSMSDESDEASRTDEFEALEPQPKKSRTKMILLIGLGIVAVAGLGVGGFFLKDIVFPPKKPVVVAKAPVKKPEPAAAPAPAPASEAESKVPAPSAPAPEAKAEPAKPAPAAPSAKTEPVKPAEPVKAQPAPAAKTEPAKPAAPAKPAEPAKAQAAKDVYSVQVGVFGVEQNAAAMAERLKKKGYDVFISKDEARKLHRVLIGRFETRQKAAEQARAVGSKEGIKAIVFH